MSEAGTTAQDRRRERLARELAHTPDPALKMRIAELEQHCAGEQDCDAWWELADLRWVLARRADSAGSTPNFSSEPTSGGTS